MFTFDEDEGADNNQIPMIVVGDGVAAELNYQQLNDYSLLATIEKFYGLPALANSAGAQTMSFSPAVSIPSR